MVAEAATGATGWSDAEKAAWAWPVVLPVHVWAEKHRYLTRRQSSRPGWWRNDQAPYLVGIMLLAVRSGIDVLTVLKAAQVGASEALRNVIAWLAVHEPDPLLLVLPNKDIGESIITNRIIPLFEDTAALRELATGRKHDITKGELVLGNDFTLRLGFSGSPTSLAAHPAKRVINDERSKFADGGKEADPEALAEERLATYEDGIIINISTPTLEPDATERSFESSNVKLYYHVPCPHCGTGQRLVPDRLRFEPTREQEPDPDRRAAEILRHGSAWFECEACGKRMEEKSKRAMVNAGWWANESQSWKMMNDGREVGPFPYGSRVGMHLPAFYSLAAKHKWPKLAAQWVAADRDPKKLQAIHNSKFAEVFRQQVSAVKVSSLAEKCRANPETGFVPVAAGKVAAWASRLIMTVDTQKDYFWAVIRAWGHRFRSHRVWHGRLRSFDEVRDVFYSGFFEYENGVYPSLRCHMMGIDSGGGKMGLDSSRTDEVYRFCNNDPAWLKPLKGDPALEKADQPFRVRKVTYQDPSARREAYDVHLLGLNVQYFGDILASAMEGKVGIVDRETGELADREAWMLNDQNDAEYNQHLSNMHKVRVAAGKGHRVDRWRPKTEGARVDYRACEVYQFGMAHGPGRCGMLPPAEMVAQQFAMARRAAETAKAAPMTTPDGRAYLATNR